MAVKIRALAPGLAALALGLFFGCERDEPMHSAVEIEGAVQAHLADRTDLRVGQMRVRADRIRYEGDRALASVSIMASDDPKAAMKMVYELVRESGGWRVVPAETAGADPDLQSSPHGAPPGLPQGHPPLSPQDGGLPPGHPPIGGGER